MSNYRLSLAPIRGLTDAHFRSLFAQHFAGFDFSIAPFINPQKRAELNDKLLGDVQPAINTVLPVIPQLLNSHAEDFVALANRLADFGYQEINWNLGCPAPMVTRKKRGSGLLAHPEIIIQLLEEIIPQLRIKLSIKTRLGFSSVEQIQTLLPQLDAFPLTEIIIHTRLGKQLYKGKTDPDSFALCQQLTRHKLAYNGDIISVDIFNELRKRFPTVEHWMIGRGALSNPFIAEEIKSGKKVMQSEKTMRLEAFHQELFAMYNEKLSGASHIIGRMKLLWQYMVHSLPEPEKSFKKIKKVSSAQKYTETIQLLFESAQERQN